MKRARQHVFHAIVKISKIGKNWRIAFGCFVMVSNKRWASWVKPKPEYHRALVYFPPEPHHFVSWCCHDDTKVNWTNCPFLWQPEDIALRVFGIQLVTWDVTSNGFLLAAVCHEHLKRVDLNSVYRLDESTYFDDLFTKCWTNQVVTFVDRTMRS